MLAASLFLFLAASVSKDVVDACGAFSQHPFELTYHNKTQELALPPPLNILKLGAYRGIQECRNQFENDSSWWNCTFDWKRVDRQLPIFFNNTLPHATPETAFLHAISAAAITYELTLKCRYNIVGCYCVRRRVSNSFLGQLGCGDNVEYGMDQTRLFFDELETGIDARTAVNRHNNRVGREIVRSSLIAWCKCHGFGGACHVKTCWKILPPFQDIGKVLKKKYSDAVPVWFVGNRLMEKIDDNMRVIKKEDTRLVYLDPSSKGYLQNDTLTPPNSEMFRKKSCTSKNSAKTNCQFFMALCSYFGLGQETVKECKRYKSTGFCRRMKTCKKTYFTTTCYRKPQGLKTN